MVGTAETQLLMDCDVQGLVWPNLRLEILCGAAMFLVLGLCVGVSWGKAINTLAETWVGLSGLSAGLSGFLGYGESSVKRVVSFDSSTWGCCVDGVLGT